MALTPGARLGPYEVAAQIGVGGMGEVYQATDTNLKRQVAIKVLPEALAADPERLARFQREAEVLAALNHPHIAHIHGLERSNGMTALVMELVEGPTLADRIADGAIPLGEALPIARQIAEALESAHEHRIIHRDLKPANIKLRPDGAVKVLDFGLAKVAEPVAATSSTPGPLSPTITTPAMTQAGLILGTAAYMSPEQAKGRVADKRSDIWAFGCVLFEMLTGGRAFGGDDVSDTLAAVLRAEPDWTALPPEVPETWRLLLQRCLEKDRRNRIADASTIRFVIDAPPSVTTAAAKLPVRASLWRRVAPMAVTAIIAGTVTGTAVWMRRGAPAQPQGLTRFPVALDESLSFASNGLPLIGISSDGSRLAYAALSRDEPTQVTQRFYIRSMSETSSKPLSGSEVRGGTVGAPVFSPDNQSIVYYTGSSGTGVYDRMRGALKRISVGGGNPETVAADVLLPMGLSWDRDTDTIVFGQPSKGILRVNARGGEPQQIISIQEGELTQGPQMLPGGDAVLFTLAQGAPAGSLGPVESTWDKADIVVQSIASGQRKTVIHGGSDARYISSGHIVYAVAGTLRAVAFDVKRLEAVGQPTLVLEGVGRARFGPVTRTGSAHVSVSASGSLVYLPGPAAPTGSLQNVAYINRNGAFESLKLTPANYEYPRISPDGKRVAVGIDDGKEANIWTYDLSRTNAIRQLTFGGGRNRFPVWSADGQYVAFQSDRDGDRAIFWQRADGMAQAVRLTRPEAGVTHVPDSWSPKNDQLLIDVQSTSGFSLAMLNVRDGKIASFEGVQSRSISPAAVFSPEGRWVAYQSGEIPVPRIFVKPASGLGPALPVVDGRSPRYSADGKQIYFTRADRMMAVEFRTEPTFSVGNPVVINQNAATGGGPIERAAQTSPSTPMTVLPRAWDLTSDGRFIGIIDEVPASTSSARHIDVVLGWFTELNQRVPLQ